MTVVLVVVRAVGVEHRFVPTLALDASSNWHRSIEPDPCPERYQALILHSTPRIVDPSGMAEKSNPVALRTYDWSPLSNDVAMTYAVDALSEYILVG
jgi:hypothetical protein